MIERPLLTPALLSSPENGTEILRRIRHGLHAARNPRNKLTVTREQYDSYFKFAFVRDPWARAFSWYQNVSRDVHHQKAMGITGPLSLREFLERYSGRGELKPQIYWMKNFSGSIPLDFIGHFETLEKDFRDVCRMMGSEYFIILDIISY